MAQHKAVVVLFLSTVCPYANYFSGHIRELAEGYAARGVLVIGVNSNKWESREEIGEHARERGFGFAMIKDEGPTCWARSERPRHTWSTPTASYAIAAG